MNKRRFIVFVFSEIQEMTEIMHIWFVFFTVTVRSILKKITKENTDFIGAVLTNHQKIKKIHVRRMNSIQLNQKEREVLSDLLQVGIFDKSVQQTVHRLANRT